MKSGFPSPAIAIAIACRMGTPLPLHLILVLHWSRPENYNPLRLTGWLIAAHIATTAGSFVIAASIGEGPVGMVIGRIKTGSLENDSAASAD